MLKSIFDFTISLFGLILISPFFFLLMILLRIKMGSPIFFTQVRPGKNGIPFKMIKFRTMTNERDNKGNLLTDSQRITKLGIFMRKSSLDELPELINVIKGDMSLVGPRPLLMQYLDVYTVEEMKRHTVRPGITGLSQVSGRNNLDWDERLKLDVEYVEKMNIKFDIIILFKTIIKVLRRDDVEVIPGANKKPLDIERNEAKNKKA